MKKRKNICLITAMPESLHVQRISSGIFHQCRKYGYNVTVFGAMTHLFSARPNYNLGEANIYDLINYELVDGVILDTATLSGDNTGETIERIYKRLKSCKKPVAALEMHLKEYPVIENRNEEILREMCRHIIQIHHKTNLCILTGPKHNEAAESRLSVFLDETEKLGVKVTPEHIVYGDFWYTSGEKLADDFISGAISMPEAVICSSDHMGLGLIERLSENGIRVPEDIIVLGFEATVEAASADISLSSYEANDTNSAADAVDHIRKIIQPGAEIIPYKADINKLFHPGASCGCEPDYSRSVNALRGSMYFTTRNYSSSKLLEEIDIGLLMESYVMEQFNGSETPEECIKSIYDSAYLLYPHINYYLCLKENWLDTGHEIIEGYPDKMKIVTASTSVNELSFYEDSQSIVFDTSLMIPRMHEETKEPSVFYFSAVHFNEKMLGYSVLQRSLADTHKINIVYRNWLRFVNSALEMIRSKRRLLIMSVRDEMTETFNRRGMYIELEKMLKSADTSNSLFVCVIDIDGLKYINDTFGHNEGDFGIKLVSSAAALVTHKNEICVRAGGDEFYIIGVGDYDETEAEKRSDRFISIIEEMSSACNKPFKVTASIGCALQKINDSLNIDEVICEADEKMYKYKIERNRQRK